MKEYFTLDPDPRKGFLALEKVMLAYAAATLLVILFTYTRLVEPEAMIWGRFRALTMTVALWAVYRLLPCRLTMLFRIVGQMVLLAWWYPDTYEINRILPNLDHVFASWEQAVFGCQPALLFPERVTSPVFSELMDLGYVSYFPMIVAVVLFYFLFRYEELEKTAFIIMAAFFIYYVIFIILPVTGPQYYYGAVGTDNIAKGVFPAVGDWFMHHSERMISPGWTDGFFYQLVEDAHTAGERPTAAFPSSHVGITVILLLLAWHTGNRRFFLLLLPFFVLMFFATVYIRAHYAIDAVAGLLTGVLLYWLLAMCPVGPARTSSAAGKRKKRH